MIKQVIQKLVDGKSLDEHEICEAMGSIMDGCATQAQIGSFITALRIKGETIQEITGCAKAMRAKALRIYPKVDYFIDTCGTGGDGAGTFNISTAAAIVAAAGGTTVAKHGNRSVSSKSGSADVLEALGVRIDLEPVQVTSCIEQIGIGFIFAPNFHKSMKYAAGPRKELGIRTIFNVLGPLTNPAGAKGQLLGVFDEKLAEPVAGVLVNLGVERALVIHGEGLDELTVSGTTRIAEVKDGLVNSYTVTPETFGLGRADFTGMLGGNAKENADIILSVLSGEKGAKRDVVLLNSAAALYVGKAVDSIAEGVAAAGEIIDSGRALSKLNQLREYTRKLIA